MYYKIFSIVSIVFLFHIIWRCSVFIISHFGQDRNIKKPPFCFYRLLFKICTPIQEKWKIRTLVYGFFKLNSKISRIWSIWFFEIQGNQFLAYYKIPWNPWNKRPLHVYRTPWKYRIVLLFQNIGCLFLNLNSEVVN